MSTDAPHTEMGRRLYAWRHGRGLSGQQLADYLGVHNSHVYRWEAGSMAPRPEHLGALRALGLSLDWLITGHGSMEHQHHD